MKRLGTAIGKRRRERGLSLREVALLVGLSRQAVVNAEKGTARLGNALRIAKAVGVPARVVLHAARADMASLSRRA